MSKNNTDITRIPESKSIKIVEYVVISNHITTKIDKHRHKQLT
jgi:hypothetical protein